MADFAINSLRGDNPLCTRENLAWAAGLFEGEGSFSYQRRGQYMTIQVELGMTDEDRVRRFHAVVGIGNVTGPHNNTKPHHKPIYRWKTGSFAGVQAIMAFMWPWLGPRRRNKAIELLTVYWQHKRQTRATQAEVTQTKELLAAGVPKRKIAQLVGKSYGFVNHIKRGRTHASAVEVAP